MVIVVTGSIAFDNIMDFPGYFKDHILPEKVHMLSVSFLVETMKRQHGGAGANVAYNLALMGERPLLVGAVGDDFGDYRAWLEKQGRRHLSDPRRPRRVHGRVPSSPPTSTTTRSPASTRAPCVRPAASRSTSVDGDISLVVITPDNPDAMAHYPGECRRRGIPYVFCPGQQTVSLSPEQLVDAVTGAKCVIGNDYEMELIADKTGHTVDGLLELAEIVVTTLGDEGSRIATTEGTTRDRHRAPRADQRSRPAPATPISPASPGDSRAARRRATSVASPRSPPRMRSCTTAPRRTRTRRRSSRQECVARFGEDLLIGRA